VGVVGEIELPHNWTPRIYQGRLWNYMVGGGKRAIDVAHRRWGKDEVCLHWTAMAAHDRIASYWHLLPQASQARKAIWDAINPHTGKRRIDEAFPQELRKRTREQDMFIEFRCGSTWQVLGSDNFNSLVGSPPAGLVLSEWALCNPAAWAYLKPILDENGGWAMFITTPRGKNHAHAMYQMAKDNPKWFAEVSNVLKTGRFSRAELDEQRAEYVAMYGEDQGGAMFEQELMCSFDAAILGAYYGKEMADAEREERICSVAHDPSLPVFTAWDIGRTDDTAIWFFQVAWGEIRVIDFYKDNGKDPIHYAEICHGRKIEVSEYGLNGKPVKWALGASIPEHAHRIAYRYGTHWLPHDARPKTFASPRSGLEQLRDFDIKAKITPSLSVQDGIQSARATLAHCWFDAERCNFGIESLKTYRREWDDEKKMFTDAPVHDWTSHASDAFRYLSLVWRNPESEKPVKKPRFLHDMTANEIFWPKQGDTAPTRERI
jgi:phage terminase large subunit